MRKDELSAVIFDVRKVNVLVAYACSNSQRDNSYDGERRN